MENFYTLDEKKNFSDFVQKIVFSKNFRRLDGKTQLFSVHRGDHFRNRMIHTEEVRTIALRIADEINNKFSNYINKDLVSCIALSHDFGHTPFGHVGERTLQAIMSGKDPLGNIFGVNHEFNMYFKHNINSMRLLIEEFGKREIPWQILDGVLKHSSLKYNSGTTFSISYLTAGTNYDPIYYKYKSSTNALTVEGQIVAVADEIAQRYSDFEDTFRAKNINIIKKILEEIESNSKYDEKKCTRYIDSVLKDLIEGVINCSTENIKTLCSQCNDSENVISYLAEHIVIDFDDKSKTLNDELAKFIKKCIFDIDELRQEDEKNKHIIRQLFKAYYNNCFQIKGQYFKDFVASLQNLKDNLFKNEQDESILKKYNNIIIKFYDKDSDYIHFNELKLFIQNLKEVAESEQQLPSCVWKLYTEYIEKICFYIASMTDDYAVSAYQFLYGFK